MILVSEPGARALLHLHEACPPNMRLPFPCWSGKQELLAAKRLSKLACYVLIYLFIKMRNLKCKNNFGSLSEAKEPFTEICFTDMQKQKKYVCFS